MIFLTVGTQFGFDRLVKAVDECIEKGLIEHEIFAQIGEGKYLPKNMKYVKTMDKVDYDRAVEECDGLISHAGMGSIAMAFSHQKPLLVMPRRACFGEVVNDHQIEISSLFQEEGYLLAAMNEGDIPDKISLLMEFGPKIRESRAQPIINEINNFLKQWQNMI